jgi:hypothetical protein
VGVLSFTAGFNASCLAGVNAISAPAHYAYSSAT